MENDEIKAVLEGLKPPEDLFAQIARQKDGFTEVWLGVRKVYGADLDCEGWYKDMRPTGEEAPAMLWCSGCEQRVVVAWMSKTEEGCRGHSHTERGIRLYDHDSASVAEKWEYDKLRCPCCGKAGRVYNTDQMRGRTEQMIITVPYVRQGVLLLVQWAADRWVEPHSTEGWSMRCRTLPLRAYAIDGKKITAWRKAVKGPYGSVLEDLENWEKLERFTDRLGIPYFYCKKPPDLRGTALENAKLWEWMKEVYTKNLFAPLAYIRLYLRHPNTEVLVTAGLGEMLAKWIKDECQAYYGYSGSYTWTSPQLHWVHWKERRPSAMLGLTRSELRKFLTWKKDHSVKKMWITTGHPAGLTMEEADQVEARFSMHQAMDMLSKGNMGCEELRKTIRYLNKQSCDWYILRDYRDMQQKLGIDWTADPLLAWPPHLRQAHDRAASAVRYEQNKGMEQKFAAMTERCRGLAWEHDGICIRPAESVEELVQEGKTLHHCVGGYGKAHADGRIILFIRHTRRPERSWFTLNVDVKEKKIIQNHGYCNEYAHGQTLHIPKAVQDFVAMWKREVLEKWTLPKPKKAQETNAGTSAA